MNKLLTTTALLLAMGTMQARADVIIGNADFCGPSSGNGCETAADQMIFLQAATGVTTVFGNYGSQTGLPIVKFTTDAGPFDVLVDAANGFATIKPDNGISFNGMDISVPGFEILALVFDEQLTPVVGQTLDPFTITADDRSGAIVQAIIDNTGDTTAANTDKEWSVTALNGTAFDDINIVSPGGFDEFKHFEIVVTPLAVAVPEIRTWAMMAGGFAMLAMIGLHKRAARYAI